MKLITLNIWGGHIREPLLEFIANCQDIDIFCLQEVYNQARATISTDDRQVSLNILSELAWVIAESQPLFQTGGGWSLWDWNVGEKGHTGFG